MVGLNQDFKKVFVTTSNTLLASGTTTALAQCQLGIFDADTYQATTAPLWGTSKAILIAQGTPDLSYMPKGAGIRNETDKSKVIIGKKILGWHKKAAATGQSDIVTVGYDGTNTSKTVSGSCDEIKHLYIRLTGKPIEQLIPNGYIVHVEAQGPCCATCGDSCAHVDARIFTNGWVDQLSQLTILGGIPISKFISWTQLYDAGTGAAGIRFTNAWVEYTTDTCYFDRFPYNADPVHIQVSTWNPDWHGARCEDYAPITVLQTVAYPFGDGQAVIRYEAVAHGWDERDYNKFDTFLRQAEGQYLCTDPTQQYDKYTLTYEVEYHVLGWSDVYRDRYDLEVFVQAGQAAFKTAINGYVTSVTGLGIDTV